MKRQPPKPVIARLRCAIYTRKSSDEGLEQSFNSLDAQREACEAYVMSQVGEGWSALSARYDDGGFSGGSMARPALKRLLADIARGQIDIVVVYKVDRLTRSLTDFARIVEAFDGKGVSFVSVTQAFNTTSSMGRLTLNVLLSFAQFEREVTGERIRDKIAASKKKGMWMGGVPPLGYRGFERTLVIDEAEAVTVRHIFDRYLALGSVHALRDHLEAEGIRARPSKRKPDASGAPFTRGALYHLLSNRLYLGEIVHKDACYPGLHPAIVERETFEKAGELLATNRAERLARNVAVSRAPLTGLIFDCEGRPMTPVAARNRHGRIYRYYVSAPLQVGGRKDDDEMLRLPAPLIEKIVLDRLSITRVATDWSDAREQLVRVEIDASKVKIVARPAGKVRLERIDAADRAFVRDDGQIELRTDIQLRAWSGRTHIVRGDNRRIVDEASVDASLVRGLARAHALVRLAKASSERTIMLDGVERDVTDSYVRRMSRLAFLAPDIQKAIVVGQQPASLTLERLMRIDLPIAWSEQRQVLGFCAA